MIPTKPGYYWAQWRQAVPGTRDGAELTPSDDWEPVQVFENALDDQHPEYMMVEVGGVEKAQSLDGFVWGAPLSRPVEDCYDRGWRDTLNALLALNPAVAAKLAECHGREPDPYGRLPFDVVFWVAEVAAQLGIEPVDDLAATQGGEHG